MLFSLRKLLQSLKIDPHNKGMEKLSELEQDAIVMARTGKSPKELQEMSGLVVTLKEQIESLTKSLSEISSKAAQLEQVSLPNAEKQKVALEQAKAALQKDLADAKSASEISKKQVDSLKVEVMTLQKTIDVMKQYAAEKFAG